MSVSILIGVLFVFLVWGFGRSVTGGNAPAWLGAGLVGGVGNVVRRAIQLRRDI